MTTLASEQPRKYFIALAGQTTPTGPFTEQQVLQGIAANQLDPNTTRIWCEGMPDWAILATQANLVQRQPTPDLSLVKSAPSVTPSSVEGTNHQKELQPHQYAGFWIRALAATIDGLVCSTATFLPTLLAASIFQAGSLNGGIANFVISLASHWAYSAFMESSTHQATLGKMALGLRVVDLNGQRLSLPHATRRYFAKFLTSFTLAIGFVMAGFTKKKQGLHDLMAKTYVVRVKR